MALNTPLTLSTLIAYVRNYTLERTGDVGLITDTEATDIINAAARMIWVRIVTKYPDTFAKRTPANVTVTAGSPLTFVQIDGGTGHQVYKVLLVAVGSVGAALSALDPINSFDRITYRQVYEPMPSTQILPARPYRYYVEGENVYFTPQQTSGNFDCRVSYVSQPQDMVAASDQLWGGLLPQYHDMVAILASMMVYGKDGNLQTGFNGIFQYLDQVLTEHFGPPSNPYSENPKEFRP